MKKLLGAFAIGIIFLATTGSCQNASKHAPQNTPLSKTDNSQPNTPPMFGDLSAADFQKKLGADNTALLVDVRTPEEFAKGHLKNATTINFFDADFKEKVGKLDKTKAVYVYCAAGGRSAKALKILQEAGFKSAYNLLGGFSGWETAGLPSVK